MSQPINYDIQNPNSSDDNITVDNGVKFINNEIIIMFNDDVEEARCKEIIKEINGKIISSIWGITDYRVQVDHKFTTYSSIEQYCRMLEEKYDEIYLVSYNSISEIDSN